MIRSFIILLLMGLLIPTYLSEKTLRDSKSQKETLLGSQVTASAESLNQPPPLTSSEDFNSERSHFYFSPDRKYISFIKDVFEEYGRDWKKYWALIIFDPQTGKEKTLFVDDSRMSSYQWIDSEFIRVFHNAGTGVRVYLDVPINQESLIFTKDFEGSGSWLPDDLYAQRAKDTQEAYRLYNELRLE